MRRPMWRPMWRPARLERLVALLAMVCLTLTACDFDVYDLPLPGGADTGSNPMTLHVEFADVLDLVPDSAVKVDEVSVGRVKDVELVDGHADVTVEVRRDTKLPANATAQIRQTSLLGEKFVSLVAPATDPSPTRLRSGDTIPLERSGRNPEIEEVLGALSLVLNGGGVAQLKTISTELNKALAGHEDAARSVLTQVQVLMGHLDDNKASIVQALESIDRLSQSVRSQEKTIDAALGELPSALQSIDAQRKDLVTMLQALSHLGDVGVRVINASKTATINVVQNLEPTLTQLANAGDSLVNSIGTALTYPFVDEVVGRDPQVARNLHMGDYVNLSIDLQVDVGGPLEDALTNPVPSAIHPTVIVGNLTKCLASLNLQSAACQAVLATPGALLNIINECKKPANKDAALCQTLNQLPGLGGVLPGLPGPAAPGGTGSAGNPLGDLLGSIGLNRAAPGGHVVTQPGPVSYDALTRLYDPTLVKLLVPGLASGPAQGKEAAK
ncbi:phospholipid/cholesterol/gamma-HCH transport system substrate-binding protein [Nocardioides terrae]|uniref:Phospholipid/cholesterol/gamma-HCH transport system substrate-binding protein n=1 Tax=Nocardioides terrae TaxID=574651 RepID=A0A1I1KI66_9ACTN|nr:MCE family protein [Nocardioides terrae]SFC60497.1 phospholipid/cholesterol/gamma-HCH transport system substrate-binding protein [Nocardioides terrae]